MNDQLEALRQRFLPGSAASPADPAADPAAAPAADLATATPWVCVAGAKGGVGKTTIAVNLAILLARSGYRTLLADLDPGCGDIGVHLRLGATSAAATAGDVLVDGPAGLKVLLGDTGSTQLLEQGSMTAQLRRLTKIARDFDVVVADTGAGIGAATMQVAHRSDLVLAVTTPDAPAVTDTYAFMKVLHRLAGGPARLVVNRARSYDEAVLTARKLDTVTTRFLSLATPLAAKITRADALELSVAEQRPLTLDPAAGATSRSAADSIEDLRALAAGVLEGIPDVRPARRAAAVTPRLRPTSSVSRSSAV